MDPAFSFSVPRSDRGRDRTGHKVLGLRLRPLTVGHLFLLLEVDSAYPDHPEAACYEDLAVSALVCSQPHSAARKLIYGRFARLAWRIWAWVARRAKWETEETEFLHYLAKQLRRPESESMSTGIPEVRAPLAWRLLAMLMADFHLTRAEALDVEVGFALTLWAVESDRRQIDKIASERQLAFRAWVKTQEAERLANEQKGGA